MALSTARFAGRTALVTGSGRKFRRAVALAFAADGEFVSGQEIRVNRGHYL